MNPTLSLLLAQLNPVVGDVAGNVARILAARAEAARQGADLVVCPELAVCGYPPEDLVLRPAFQDAVEQALRSLADSTVDGGPALLVGGLWRGEDGLHNAALLLDEGAIKAVRFKRELPNYGVFDEKRVFAAGPIPAPVPFRGWRLGVMVCEDMWYEEVAAGLAQAGAELFVVLNGSPFETRKAELRLDLAARRVAEHGLALAYVNQVGGQDELVFDGASFVLDGQGTVMAQAPSFAESLTLTRWRRDAEGRARPEPAAVVAAPDDQGAIYAAMVLGLRDYVTKNGFPGVVLGLSGGIDSALSAAVAVDALGAQAVRCVMLPSPYTSVESLEDAAQVAANLGVRLDEVAIHSAMAAFKEMLGPLFEGRESDITEENIQARARGLTLMAISNKFGPMVLTTGNKSEMSVGYATLYGDMCGGYSVLKDVYKTTVFALSLWRNVNRPDGALGPEGEVIPLRVIEKPPSAELKPNQTDQDSLPPYEVLDDILSCLIEEEMSQPAIVARGHEPETVARVWRLLIGAEYKRRQAPPGVKITRRSFGRDRRYPITNRFRGEG